MQTFDYARAWAEVARPAFLALGPDVRALVAEVATVAADLHQAADLTQTWPADGGALRARFEALPLADLALAAHVVYFTGHWFPAGGDLDLPGRAHGAHWKFSHYADQVLRARLGLAGGEAGRDDTPGVSVRCHEGRLRLCYSSRDAWQWVELAPATDDGLTTAQGLAAGLQGALTARRGADRDAQAAAWFRTVAEPWRPAADAAWAPWFGVAARYRVDESEIIRPTARIDWAARIAEVQADLARAIGDASIRAAGLTWFLEREIDPANVIFYPHTQRWGIGWRHALTDAAIAQWLDLLAEFPYDYDIEGYAAYRDRQNGLTGAAR